MSDMHPLARRMVAQLQREVFLQARAQAEAEHDARCGYTPPPMPMCRCDPFALWREKELKWIRGALGKDTWGSLP